METDLSWTGGDPDVGDTVTYDVYFGTSEAPPLKESVGPYPADQTSISYTPGVLSYDTKYYWKIVARDNYGITKEGSVWNFTTVATVLVGVTGEVNCDILPGVTVKLFKDGTLIGSDTSDENGNYSLPVPELGEYEVIASKEGFRNETQSISITELESYTLDFRAETGLVPKAPNMSYVLECVNHWLYPEPPCGLSMSKVLAVINAWLYPQE